MRLNVAETTLDTLLGTPEEQFRVPLYQRPYSWTKAEVDELWNDIANMQGDEHFMGSIVLNDEIPNRPEIIDGQQRLTTLMILLGLIRDEYAALESRFVARPQRRLEADEWAESSDGRFKLKLGGANWPIFRDFVLRPPHDPTRRLWSDRSTISPREYARNTEIFENARELQKKLAEWLGSVTGASREKRLVELEQRVAKGLKFVSIRVDNVDDAFLLFETLNDRGLQLSAADLVKSHLLSRFESENGKERIAEAAQDWSDVIDSLRGADIGRFLRYYLLMYYDKVQKDQVFRLFKKRLEDTAAEALLVHLRRMARYYGEFDSPEMIEHVRAREALADLRDLRATTCYVALLPARDALSDDLEEFSIFARLTEALAYRWTTIVGLNAQELESIFQAAGARFIRNGAAGLAEAAGILAAAMPTREEFLASFNHKRMGTQYVARYTLRRIEAVLRTSEVVLGPATKVHIEHVMPQNLSRPWLEFLGDDARESHGEYVNRWGNLTLLDEKINRSARDAAFAEKVQIYTGENGKESMIRMTQLLGKEQEWGPKQIENRQKWLALIAEQLWSEKGIARPENLEIPEYPFVDPSDGEREIREIVGQHESATVEFKSTARMNTRTNKKDPVVEAEVIRAITAFANSAGGTLLIGVTDDGQICGVDSDYAVFGKKGGRDAHGRWISEYVKNAVDPVLAQSLKINYYSIEARDVCRVDVAPSGRPVFAKEKGSQHERFFVRMNNATHELHGKAMVEYQEGRWQKQPA